MPTGFDAGLSAVDGYVGQAPDESRALMAAKCRGLLAGYHARWADAEYLPVAVERVVQSDLWNPETGRKSRSFTVAGKIDLSAAFRDRVVLMDHKTTSEDISDPNSPYWRQLIVEGQPSHYMLLEWLNARKADDAVWDVVRKPAISPKLLTKAEARSAAVTHEYFGRHIADESILALNVEKPRETLEMYEARLAHDCTLARPEWYFQRRSIPRLDAELHEYAVELWEHGQEILHARNTGRHARNSGACMLYGGPCKFLGICSIAAGFGDRPGSGAKIPAIFLHKIFPGGFAAFQASRGQRKILKVQCKKVFLQPFGSGQAFLKTPANAALQAAAELSFGKSPAAGARLGIQRGDQRLAGSEERGSPTRGFLFFRGLRHNSPAGSLRLLLSASYGVKEITNARGPDCILKGTLKEWPVRMWPQLYGPVPLRMGYSKESCAPRPATNFASAGLSVRQKPRVEMHLLWH